MRLEEVLKRNIGKWVQLTFTDKVDNNSYSITGILREANDDYILIEGILKHYLNTKAITIRDLVTK